MSLTPEERDIVIRLRLHNAEEALVDAELCKKHLRIGLKQITRMTYRLMRTSYEHEVVM